MNPQLLAVLAIALAATGLACGWIAWRRVRIPQPVAAGGGATAATGPSSLWRALISPLARLIRPRGRDLDKLIVRLQYAGIHGKNGVDRFLEEKVLALLLGAGIGFGLFSLVPGGMGFFLMLASIVGGIVFPGVSVDGKAAKRRDEVSASLPGAIDLLMTCVDAGLSIEQAIARVAREISRSSLVLASELGTTSSECEAGVPLAEALRRLARRVDVDDLTGLCIVITARMERMAMLEERAGKLAVKLILPLALFLLPSALVAMLGPAGIQVMRALK
jgi:tight adherence protein C